MYVNLNHDQEMQTISFNPLPLFLFSLQIAEHVLGCTGFAEFQLFFFFFNPFTLHCISFHPFPAR